MYIVLCWEIRSLEYRNQTNLRNQPNRLTVLSKHKQSNTGFKFGCWEVHYKQGKRGTVGDSLVYTLDNFWHYYFQNAKGSPDWVYAFGYLYLSISELCILSNFFSIFIHKLKGEWRWCLPAIQLRNSKFQVIRSFKILLACKGNCF